jgi:hypothetical protein
LPVTSPAMNVAALISLLAFMKDWHGNNRSASCPASMLMIFAKSRMHVSRLRTCPSSFGSGGHRKSCNSPTRTRP